jgi:uncharacterized protein YbjT (DUF2867 family)
MILVIGGTGTTGHAILRRLSELDVGARALVRPTSSAHPAAVRRSVTRRPDLSALPGIRVVPGDAGDPESLAAAMRGATQVVLSMGNGPSQLDLELAVVHASVAAGVQHLVKVSAPVVGPDVPVAIARLHYAVETELLDSGIDHTFLRPYAFQQNLLNMAGVISMAGFFTGITGNTRMNMVDIRDVAEVAAVALTTTRTRGRALVLTGPEAVSYPEVAAKLTGMGRRTRYANLSPEKFRRNLRRAGLPPWLVDHLEEIQSLALAYPEIPTETVREITGRGARSVDDFLAENLDSFVGPLRRTLRRMSRPMVAARATAG